MATDARLKLFQAVKAHTSELGSGLIDHSQKTTVAAMQIADR
jgi:hypothetical protein